MDDRFDQATMAQLRALRRDRSLTIAGGSRPCVHPDEETGEVLTEMILWLDLGKKAILSGCSTIAANCRRDLVSTLIQAMVDPDESASPRLPRRVIVEDPDLAQEVRPPLSRLGVDVSVAPVPLIEPIAEVMREAIENQPRWAIHTASALPLFQAAAALWAAEPWDLLPEDSPSALIEIEGERGCHLYASAGALEDDSAFVAFYLSREDYEVGLEYETEDDESQTSLQESSASPVGMLRAANALWVSFLPAEDLPEDQSEFVKERRLPVGSGTAYPLFLSASRDEEPQTPDDDQARVLTLGMDALSRFCLRNKRQLLREEPPIESELLVLDGDRLVRARVTCPVPPP